jgi:hypothetical protein
MLSRYRANKIMWNSTLKNPYITTKKEIEMPVFESDLPISRLRSKVITLTPKSPNTYFNKLYSTKFRKETYKNYPMYEHFGYAATIYTLLKYSNICTFLSAEQCMVWYADDEDMIDYSVQIDPMKRYLIIPLTLVHKPINEKPEIHSNMIIVDYLMNQIEVYEPMGFTSSVYKKDIFDDYITQKFDGMKLKTIRGFQSYDTADIGYGLCKRWSHTYVHLRLKFGPDFIITKATYTHNYRNIVYNFMINIENFLRELLIIYADKVKRFDISSLLINIINKLNGL